MQVQAVIAQKTTDDPMVLPKSELVRVTLDVYTKDVNAVMRLVGKEFTLNLPDE